jgi:hypothetical protein
MGASSLVFDELVSRMAQKVLTGARESRLEPILEGGSGRTEGYLVESSLERVVVVAREHDVLSLADISTVRRAMMRAQARRALLYIPLTTIIPNPVMLLATLSRVEIVRLTATDSVL